MICCKGECSWRRRKEEEEEEEESEVEGWFLQ
jgi:hypothetical protein